VNAFYVFTVCGIFNANWVSFAQLDSAIKSSRPTLIEAVVDEFRHPMPAKI
jgi:hypothetical protein